tara:strand:- start:265 stop:663 length:399 start_codon:yes stop_codon:yes gene_type:complete
MIKIYKIIDNTNGNIYIGQTRKKYLCQRLAAHKYDYKSKKNTCSSGEIIKNGDYRMELIEETDDKSRERYWVENTDCVNERIPGRTVCEYYQAHKEKIIENSKQNNNYKYSWGGDTRFNNNLLKIDTELFYY